MARIVIDEKVRHGKAVIEGTRITVDEALHLLENGMSYEEIEAEYGLTKEDILAVIRYASSLIQGEEIHPVTA